MALLDDEIAFRKAFLADAPTDETELPRYDDLVLGEAPKADPATLSEAWDQSFTTEQPATQPAPVATPAPVSFGDAFAAARAKEAELGRKPGTSQFEWKGKLFNTQVEADVAAPKPATKPAPKVEIKPAPQQQAKSGTKLDTTLKPTSPVSAKPKKADDKAWSLSAFAEEPKPVIKPFEITNVKATEKKKPPEFNAPVEPGKGKDYARLNPKLQVAQDAAEVDRLDTRANPNRDFSQQPKNKEGVAKWLVDRAAFYEKHGKADKDQARRLAFDSYEKLHPRSWKEFGTDMAKLFTETTSGITQGMANYAQNGAFATAFDIASLPTRIGDWAYEKVTGEEGKSTEALGFKNSATSEWLEKHRGKVVASNEGGLADHVAQAASDVKKSSNASLSPMAQKDAIEMDEAKGFGEAVNVLNPGNVGNYIASSLPYMFGSGLFARSAVTSAAALKNAGTAASNKLLPALKQGVENKVAIAVNQAIKNGDDVAEAAAKAERIATERAIRLANKAEELATQTARAASHKNAAQAAMKGEATLAATTGNASAYDNAMENGVVAPEYTPEMQRLEWIAADGGPEGAAAQKELDRLYALAKKTAALKIASQSGIATGAFTALGSVVANKIMGGSADDAIANIVQDKEGKLARVTVNASEEALKQGIKTGVKETVQETAQVPADIVPGMESGLEKDPDIGKSVAISAVTGAAMGLGSGTISGAMTRSPAKPNTPEEEFAQAFNQPAAQPIAPGDPAGVAPNTNLPPPPPELDPSAIQDRIDNLKYIAATEGDLTPEQAEELAALTAQQEEDKWHQLSSTPLSEDAFTFDDEDVGLAQNDEADFSFDDLTEAPPPALEPIVPVTEPVSATQQEAPPPAPESIQPEAPQAELPPAIVEAIDLVESIDNRVIDVKDVSALLLEVAAQNNVQIERSDTPQDVVDKLRVVIAQATPADAPLEAPAPAGPVTDDDDAGLSESVPNQAPAQTTPPAPAPSGPITQALADAPNIIPEIAPEALPQADVLEDEATAPAEVAPEAAQETPEEVTAEAPAPAKEDSFSDAFNQAADAPDKYEAITNTLHDYVNSQTPDNGISLTGSETPQQDEKAAQQEEMLAAMRQFIEEEEQAKEKAKQPASEVATETPAEANKEPATTESAPAETVTAPAQQTPAEFAASTNQPVEAVAEAHKQAVADAIRTGQPVLPANLDLYDAQEEANGQSDAAALEPATPASDAPTVGENQQPTDTPAIARDNLPEDRPSDRPTPVSTEVTPETQGEQLATQPDEDAVLAGKRAVYAAYSKGTPEDVAIRSALKAQEVANARNEPMVLWESKSGALGLVPESNTTPFENGKKIGTIYPETSTQPTGDTLATQPEQVVEETRQAPSAQTTREGAITRRDARFRNAHTKRRRYIHWHSLTEYRNGRRHLQPDHRYQPAAKRTGEAQRQARAGSSQAERHKLSGHNRTDAQANPPHTSALHGGRCCIWRNHWEKASE
jgi:hypothetical protein